MYYRIITELVKMSSYVNIERLPGVNYYMSNALFTAYDDVNSDKFRPVRLIYSDSTSGGLKYEGTATAGTYDFYPKEKTENFLFFRISFLFDRASDVYLSAGHRFRSTEYSREHNFWTVFKPDTDYVGNIKHNSNGTISIDLYFADSLRALNVPLSRIRYFSANHSFTMSENFAKKLAEEFDEDWRKRLGVTEKPRPRYRYSDDYTDDPELEWVPDAPESQKPVSSSASNQEVSRRRKSAVVFKPRKPLEVQETSDPKEPHKLKTCAVVFKRK